MRYRYFFLLVVLIEATTGFSQERIVTIYDAGKGETLETGYAEILPLRNDAVGGLGNPGLLYRFYIEFISVSYRSLVLLSSKSRPGHIPSF